MTPGALDARIAWALVGALAVLAVALQLPFADWMVDDAGISLAYARHVAEGLGPVPFPGAEPVEGYSNTLWVALLAAAYSVGLDGELAATLLGAACAAGAVVVVGRGLRSELGDWGALWAAALLAGNAMVAIWSQSGLENGLFVLLMALGLWRLATPGDRIGAPVAFLGLALTRPEGVVYAMVGAAAHLVLTEVRGPRTQELRQPLRVVGAWALLFALPFVAYQLLRYGLFAFPMPATYYVKVGLRPPDYFAWDARQWQYLVRYAWQMGQGPLLPLALLGLVGARRAAGFGLWLATSLLFYGVMSSEALPQPTPTGQPIDPVSFRLVTTVVVVLGVPTLIGWVRRPWLGAVATLGLVGLAFAVRANGDWMRGFRFLSFVAVPASVLAAASLREAFRALASVSGRSVAHAGVGTLMVLLLAPHVRYLAWYPDHLETSVEGIRKRGDYLNRNADLLRLWRRPVAVDHDMGGLLLASADRLDIRDTRGLVDLPFALHKQRPRVVDQTLRDDARAWPTFVHLHTHTKRALHRRRWFRDRYVEVPGVPTGSGVHDGQFVRRDALLGPRFDGQRRKVSYVGIDLLGWRVRSPEVAAGHSVLLEVALERTGPLEDVTLHAFLVDRQDQVWARWEVDPGYGLYPPSDWVVGEELHGRYVVPLPDDLPEGWLNIGFYLTGPDDSPLPFVKRTPRAKTLASVNEVRYSNAVKVVTDEQMREAADADRDKSHDKAKDRSCKTAETRWEDAIAHRAGSESWRTSRIWKTHARLAACWADRGRRKAEDLRLAEPDLRDKYDTPEEMLLDAVSDVLRARSWDPREERVARAAAHVAPLCLALAHTLESRGELEEARQWYDRAARVRPELVWARRDAERLRAELLKLPSQAFFSSHPGAVQ